MMNAVTVAVLMCGCACIHSGRGVYFWSFSALNLSNASFKQDGYVNKNGLSSLVVELMVKSNQSSPGESGTFCFKTIAFTGASWDGLIWPVAVGWNCGVSSSGLHLGCRHSRHVQGSPTWLDIWGRCHRGQVCQFSLCWLLLVTDLVGPWLHKSVLCKGTRFFSDC